MAIAYTTKLSIPGPIPGSVIHTVSIASFNLTRSLARYRLLNNTAIGGATTWLYDSFRQKCPTRQKGKVYWKAMSSIALSH